jgi:23S rRNA pseudouridine1911/1915/1917 synthase
MDFDRLAKLVLFEDNHLLVVNKPHGILTQGDKTGDLPIVDEFKKYIKIKYDKPGKVFLHPVSRLDRPASGALILARTSKGLSRMTELIRKRDIKKEYMTIVHGILSEHQAELNNYLLKDNGKNRVAVVNRSTPKAKLATLSYEVNRYLDSHTIVHVNLHTGRPHQIRVQFAAIGHSIVGDQKYGKSDGSKDSKLYLHCCRLSFIHPVKKTHTIIEAPFPKQLLWKEMMAK